MKKILILVNHDLVIYNFRKELVQRLLSSGYDVTVISPYGSKIEKLRDMGCNYENCTVDRRGMDLIKDAKLFFLYLKLIKKYRPSIILTFTIKPYIYGGLAARIKRVPCICNITGLGPVFEESGLLQKLLIFLCRISLKNTACIFFQNEKNKALFDKYRIHGVTERMLPGSGVNLTEFVPFPYPKTEPVRFVLVARIMKGKGIDEYLTAAKNLRKEMNNVQFEICGFFEDEHYNDIFTVYEEKKIIIYHGLVEDMKEIYRSCHCVVLPSYREGLSNVILEAAACGRPAIVSDIPGCREAVEDMKTGFLVKVGDAEDLTVKMKKFVMLSTEEKERMGRLAREKMEKEFNRSIVVDTYLEEIEKNGR